MTKQEYEEYEKRVAGFMEKEGLNNLTSGGEPFFSWHQCECCGSTLGGDRLMASGGNPTEKQMFEYEICRDCEYYGVYGVLDDMTMMEIEGEGS